MNKILNSFLAALLISISLQANSGPKNLMQGMVNFVPYPWFFQTGLSYDRLCCNKFTLGTSLWYERAALDVFDWHGVGADFNSKFMFWRFSHEAFGSSLFLSPTIGLGFFKLGHGSYRAATGQTISFLSDKELRIPLSLTLGYMHRFANDLVISAGIKAQPITILFPLKDSGKSSPFWFNLLPRLELSIGYAF